MVTPVINGLDHLVLTVADIDVTCEFYERTLGFKVISFGGGRKALKFGVQKINLHQKGREFEPKAKKPTTGSGDLCFLTGQPIGELKHHLESVAVTVIEGPIERTGATGPILSIYFRDPDGNLIEVANQL
ncbi:MAG: VOC family protein [Rhodospirillaceae bacterium]|jgi:catechol 2,3-dioxygenase-like lactoylglutathione lyase family enzyme|nr:VOC family protein [Rhodospirillaceae bacterium]